MIDIKPTPWSPVGYLTYKRTYSRRFNDNDIASPTEEWDDTINRVVAATDKQLKVGFTDDEKQRLRKYMTELKGTVAGRFLWQLGTRTVKELGLPSLQNCAFTVIDHPVRPFTWAMDMLMLGSGVGYNIQREHVYQMPPVRSKFKAPVRIDNASADYIVPDTREGWVKLLGKTLKAAFYAEHDNTFSYSVQLVRGQGAPIKGFGGVASGPEILCEGISNISKVIEARKGKRLRPIDCLDIMNIIGSIVVAGNVRRSAQIAIGDCDDIEYLNAKRWDLGNIPMWRAYSNNSVVCDDASKLPPEFWEGYSGKGEPYGLINLTLSRKVGRLGEEQYPDPEVMGYNPCAEQSLAPYETCCLAEVFLPNVETEEELKDVVTLLYRINKHSLSLHCHLPETQSIVHKNMRMGIGITGYLQASKTQRSWLSNAYQYLREYDKEYSLKNGFNPSIKLTTIKPSGTLSLLPGVTPGCHPGYARHMIRRIRVASDHSLVNVIKDHGYHVEYQRNFDGTDNRSTVVAEFPFSYPEGTTLAADMSALDQLKIVKELQANWSDNAVSCTVYYKLEELDEIKQYLAENYTDNHKSLSFLLHSGHGFDQAPYEEISEERYNQIVQSTRLITSVAEAGDMDGDDCATGACPIR